MFELKKNDINMVTMKWYINNLKDKIQILPNYTEQNLEKVINDIMNNFSIGAIVITDKNELVEGHKRINAIHSFIDGNIKYNGKIYSELSPKEKKLFDNYYLAIVV